MSRAPDTRGERIIHWIEEFCLYPTSPEKGQRVRLTPMQKETLRRVYDSPPGLQADPALIGPLAAYVALYHLCGLLAAQREPPPALDSDTFTVWASTGPELKAVLKRDGEAVTCPELGTRWPTAA
jgi:hypothetical protein